MRVAVIGECGFVSRQFPTVVSLEEARASVLLKCDVGVGASLVTWATELANLKQEILRHVALSSTIRFSIHIYIQVFSKGVCYFSS